MTPDPASTATGLTVGGTLTWMWSNRKWISEQLAALKEWYWQPDQRPILLLGPGGCGKSTLLRILSGERDWLTDNPWVYDECKGIEKQPLADDPHVQVVAAPGQPHRASVYWHDIQSELAAGKYRGVVLLTAYGYHTLGEGMRVKSHPLYQPGVPKPTENFLTRYLPNRRADELRVLRQLAEPVKTCRQPIWLLTVVAKADLWTDEREDVSKFYSAGEYGEVIADLAAALGPGRFRHELSLVSLVIANFATVAGDMIQRSIAGYDHQAQVVSVRKLIECVAALKDWEGTT